jgi:WD40 repeat protein
MGYDAFISYSHAADGLLAPRLQDGLQRFAKPWWRRRSLHVFRDESGLSNNPALWSSITSALDDSRYFVLLASPEAARSEWVNREIEYWVDHKDPSKMLVVVTDGTWVWDSAVGGFAATATAVPAALVAAAVFAEEPRHTDMRWARDDAQVDLRNGRFRDQVAEIAAPIHGIAKDDLAGVDVVQHRRTLRMALGAAIALVALTVLAGFTAAVAATNASAAQSARKEADANAARAQSNADEANRQKAAAEAAAAEATRQEHVADASAAAATQAQGRAEASASEADQQRAAAVASAEEAQLARIDADRNAANALMQKQAADTAAEQLRLTAAELQDRKDALDQSLAETAAARDAALDTNEQLLIAQGDLDAARLVALSETERTRGNFDTAMLLANEAIDTAHTDKTPARNQALAVQTDALNLERYLPGPSVPAGAEVITGTDHVAVRDRGAAGTSAPFHILVWDLRRPTTDPIAVGSFDHWHDYIDWFAFSHDGTRLIVVVRTYLDNLDYEKRVTVWDTAETTDRPLWSSTNARRSVLAPDGQYLAVENTLAGSGPLVTLVDLDRVASPDPVVARWDGELLEGFGCPSDFLGRRDASFKYPVPCSFGRDGRYLLGWSAAKFVLWDRLNPRWSQTLYTPTGFTDRVPLPQFITPGVVVGVTDPTTLTVFTTSSMLPGGDPVPWSTWHVTEPISALSVAPDGTFAVVVAPSGAVTRIDLNTGATTSMSPVPHNPFCELNSVLFSPKGQWAIVGTGFFCFWVRTSVPSPPARPAADANDAIAVGRTAGGEERYVIRRDGTVFDLEAGTTTTLTDSGSCLAAPVGDVVICGNEVVRLDSFDPASRARSRPQLGIPLASSVRTFDPAGTKLFGVMPDAGRVWVADLNRTRPGALVASVPGPGRPGQANNAVALLSPDGTRLFVADEQAATIHDLTTGAVTPMPGLGDAVNEPVFAGNERLIFRHLRNSGGEEIDPYPYYVSDVVDTSTGTILRTVPGRIVPSLDGTLYARYSDDPSTFPWPVDLLAASDLHLVRTVPNLLLYEHTLTINRDGSQIAIPTGVGIAIIDTTSGALVANIPRDGFDLSFSPFALAFSPDGTTVAADDAAYVTLFEVSTGREIGHSPVDPPACGVAPARPLTFSPNGSLLIGGGRIFDTTTVTPVGSPLVPTKHELPDECDKPIWWLTSAAFPGHPATLDYAVVTDAPTNGPLRVDVHRLTLGVADLRKLGCATAGRNFTATEWARFKPHTPYKKTCKQWDTGT